MPIGDDQTKVLACRSHRLVKSIVLGTYCRVSVYCNIITINRKEFWLVAIEHCVEIASPQRRGRWDDEFNTNLRNKAFSGINTYKIVYVINVISLDNNNGCELLTNVVVAAMTCSISIKFGKETII